MFYIRVENGRPAETSDSHPGCGPHWVGSGMHLKNVTGWMSSRDFNSFEDARTMAAYLTAMKAQTFLPVDEGNGTYPRFRVIEAPAVGDEVSRSFNGDSYPCGKITKITPTWQVTTNQGSKFLRYKETGGWREAGRGFWMIAGTVDERNPHF